MDRVPTLIVVLGLSALTGCATAQKYEAKLNSWKGHPVESLIHSWGVPTKTMALPSGGQALEYDRQWKTTGMAMVDPYSGMVMANSKTRWCTTTFITDASNVITTWSYRGNNCVSE